MGSLVGQLAYSGINSGSLVVLAVTRAQLDGSVIECDRRARLSRPTYPAGSYSGNDYPAHRL